MMEVAAFIDWLSVTHHKEIEASHDAIAERPDMGRAMLGYTKALVYPSGTIELWNEKRPDMGHHFIYSGKVLQRIAERYGTDRDEILAFHKNLQGRIARLDLALDIRSGGIDLNELWAALENGEAKTNAKHTRTQSGNNKGTTLYVGSLRNRKKLLRIYDKAKELGDFMSDYIRVELETHSYVAQNAADIYQDSGANSASIIGMVRAFCDFPNNIQWRTALSTDAIKVPVGTHQQSDTEKWLLNIVAPAYARVLAENPDFHTSFMEAVKLCYNRE